jgi:hypothetical protein
MCEADHIAVPAHPPESDHPPEHTSWPPGKADPFGTHKSVLVFLAWAARVASPQLMAGILPKSPVECPQGPLKKM